MKLILTLVFITLIFIFNVLNPRYTTAQVAISINPNLTYQTFDHWEAVRYAKYFYYVDLTPSDGIDMLHYQQNAAFPNYIDDLLNQSVDLGMNRVRLEIRSGVENPTDWYTEFASRNIPYNVDTVNDPNPPPNWWRKVRYEIVNDNADPNVIDFSNFHFTDFDEGIDNVLVPFKQKLAAQGKPLYINLTYVDFGTSTFEHKSDPEEFADFILATFQHLDQKYGWLPDAVEILEPNNASLSAQQHARQFVAAGQRLAANGYFPDFIGPSHAFLISVVTDLNCNTTGTYFENFINTSYNGQTPLDYLTEFSYHLYNGNNTCLRQKVLSLAQANQLETSMLEWWFGSALNTWKALHDDLKIARNSAWEHGTFYGMFAVDDDINPSNPTVTIADKTKYLQHYIRYIKSGAVRISATAPGCNDNQDDTACTLVNPLAFINPDGTYLVVVRTNTSGQAFSIQGLPAGTYKISYTYGTASGQHSLTKPDQTITSGQALSESFPANTKGVMTIYSMYSQQGSGDANNDGKIDGIDYVIWLNHYNTATTNGAGDGDFNGDGVVDGVDYVLWLGNYNP